MTLKASFFPTVLEQHRGHKRKRLLITKNATSARRVFNLINQSVTGNRQIQFSSSEQIMVIRN